MADGNLGMKPKDLELTHKAFIKSGQQIQSK